MSDKGIKTTKLDLKSKRVPPAPFPYFQPLHHHFSPASRRSKRCKKTFPKIFSAIIWLICGLIVMYQSFKCVLKYLENPKGAEISMTDGMNEMFPHFTICSDSQKYVTTSDCDVDCMKKGDFWYKNGIVQDVGQFTRPLEFMLKDWQQEWQSTHDETDNIREFLVKDKLPITPLDTRIWKPIFFNLFNGQCYTLQLNKTGSHKTKKLVKIVLNIQSNENIRIFPHSPGMLRTLALPTWHQGRKGNYKYDVQYQLFRMLDNHGEPCNASVYYSVDQCTEDEAFKESMESIGCTVPFFENKNHVCTNKIDAAEALRIYKNYGREKAKSCLKPCNYLKAYMIQSHHNAEANFKQVMFKFGEDSIQVTSAFEVYGGLSLFADLGGYMGMFLGFSFSQFSGFADYIVSKCF